MKRNLKDQKGITLIALVITVIVMLIISAVAISAITDPEGIFSQVREAGDNYNRASQNEADEINELINQYLNGGITTPEDSTDPVEPIKANAPKLLTGMTAVTFNTDGTTVPVTNPTTNTTWYNYENKQWANAETEDGSLWVWIPRFAYKITYTDTTEDHVNDPIDKSQGGTIDVVFLKEKSNNYTYTTDEGTTAAGTASATLDTSTYTLHPSFKKAVNGDFSHGEWDEELTGYWVAKFEAGWQQGDAINTTANDKTKAVASNVAFQDANTNRYLKDITNITYPVFKGATYAMNFISIADSFAICRHMTDATIEQTDGSKTNFYGLSATDADAHMMKNSEWGACAYLGYSQYGSNGDEIYINNANLSGSSGIYAVTGYTGAEVSLEQSNVLTDTTKIWPWYTTNGQLGSNTHNITGVFDMSGGTWERIAGYIANGNGNLEEYGTVGNTETDKLIATTETSNEVTTLSTKYSTMYRNNEDTQEKNYNANKNNGMYGDAIVETSSSYTGTTSWNTDYSNFIYDTYPFFIHGGGYYNTTGTGSFAFNPTGGDPHNSYGFRAVLCPK